MPYHLRLMPSDRPSSVPTLGSYLGATSRLFAYCDAPGCSHRAELDIKRFCAEYGKELTTIELRRRLTCGKCRQRKARLSVEPILSPVKADYGKR